MTRARPGARRGYDEPRARWPGADPDRAVYEVAPTGALILQVPRDDAFTALLREAVPEGFLTWSRSPFCWVVDADYADDALALAHRWFPNLDVGAAE